MSGERTEQATPQRKQKAQKEGDRPRSRDLLAAGATLAGVLTLGALGSRWVGLWRTAYQQFLQAAVGGSWDSEGSLRAILGMRQVGLMAVWPIGAIFGAVFGGALIAGVAQGGGVNFRLAALQPKFERLSPGKNLQNLFSMQAISRLCKSLLPAAVVAVMALAKLKHQQAVPAMSLNRLPAMFGDAYDLLEDAAWVLLVWAAIDYGLEWRSWTRRLRMSKQEMREEFKESEGNPQVRGRIRNLQRQMRRRQLKADVSHATVVITNPTHYAIVLSFDFETMETPRLLAKGRNLLAEEIKREARWAGVPIVENPPLARSLYKSVEPGQPIPLELYAAVAGILAYLYRKEVEEKMWRRQQEEAARTAASATWADSGDVSPNAPQIKRSETTSRSSQPPSTKDTP